ncbi:MAG TPA: sigma-54 dependent transcriptional regulator [Longimicrobiaceae bacterium]|nr:sigma-54 dependent transcriptional regulator [Longimicrobiaceae bacterium]
MSLRAPGRGIAPVDLRPFIGESVAVRQVREMARHVAAKNVTVLVNGESGTGKEVLARYLHTYSTRADRPFVAINCAALPETLVESELFGHEKGAFTGASNLKHGCFEEANGGTLFLDEVTEIRPHIQAKLLRALQESEIQRVGAMRPIKVDVRIIASSSRDIETCLAEGRLREDLYYRLCTVELCLSPLRERLEDVLPLSRCFLRKYADTNGSRLVDVSPEALKLLEGYRWPGNVRELENVIARATALAAEHEEYLQPHHLPPKLHPSPEVRRIGVVPQFGEDLVGGLHQAVAAVKRQYVEEALRRAEGNKAKAARLLGVSRRGLYNLLDA